MSWPCLDNWHVRSLCAVETRPCHSLYREALEELVDLLVRHLLAELGKDVAELAGADHAVASLVEHLEALDELLCVSVFILGRLSGAVRTSSAGGLPAVGAVQDVDELVEVDCGQ